MKKITSIIVLFVLMLTVTTGCLKDKGFENHEYGINSPETSPVGIGLPLAANTQTYGLDLSATPQVVADILVANLLGGKPAPADIKVNLTLKPTLIADYNTANGTSAIVLPSSIYTVPSSLVITIKQGETLGKLPINISSTTSLDASVTYALGFSISSTDAGYTIASNLKDLLILFNIKNKYDGIYNLTGYHNRTPYTFPYDINVLMITTGPTSVAMYLNPPFGDYGQPIGTAPGAVGWYGNAVSPNFGFDPTTNIATTISGMYPGVTYSYNTDPGVVNSWNPVTKKMTISWQYNGNPLRRFYDTLVYKGPR